MSSRFCNPIGCSPKFAENAEVSISVNITVPGKFGQLNIKDLLSRKRPGFANWSFVKLACVCGENCEELEKTRLPQL
jgi:hypothetical protein